MVSIVCNNIPVATITFTAEELTSIVGEEDTPVADDEQELDPVAEADGKSLTKAGTGDDSTATEVGTQETNSDEEGENESVPETDTAQDSAPVEDKDLTETTDGIETTETR